VQRKTKNSSKTIFPYLSKPVPAALTPRKNVQFTKNEESGLEEIINTKMPREY